MTTETAPSAEEIRKSAAMSVAIQLSEEAKATPVRNEYRSGPRITSLRIQISEELGKMNVFELGNVLAYCQALPLKNKLAA